MTWTNDQENAIIAKGNVIVTAAAGSGKTAVLVERVIRKLCDDKNPIPADRLLIVTFTAKAAEEMRQRIEEALAKKCAENPHNTNYLRQQLLISAADICTIDSFCIRFVRNNFATLGISPDFKIVDKNTFTKIRLDILQEMFDEYFEKQDEEFLYFLKITNSISGYATAINFILDIKDYCQKLPESTGWLDRVSESYDPEKIADSIWVKGIMDNTAENFEEFVNQLNSHLKDIVTDAPLFDKYNSFFEKLRDYFALGITLANKGDFLEFAKHIKNMPGLVAKFACPSKGDKVLFETFKPTYNSIKKWVKDNENAIWLDQGELKKEFTICYGVINKIAEIVKEFLKRYYAELEKRSMATFSYISYQTMKLLTKIDENGNMVPTDIAKEIADQYDEVMVDEYQDINNLQGMIFNIISNNGEKLFTVGDIKQSIYAFRGSVPEYFSERSELSELYYKGIDENKLKRVVLSKNFRSRKGVCDFANAFFSSLMSKKCGGVEYDSNEILDPEAKYPENNLPCVETHFINAENDLDNFQAEAEFLGDYILKTINEPAFLKKNDDELRKAEFKDFTILLRTFKHLQVYVDALKNRGIPVSVGSGNYFKTTEILTVLSLIKALDNPMDDISMLAVMLSPIFGFSEDDVLNLKTSKNKGKLYLSAVENAKNGNFICQEFIQKFNTWRRLAACMPIPEFISTLLVKSGYYNIVLSMNYKERRHNNLILLEQFAKSYHEDCAGDLSGFVRYLDYLKESTDTKSVSGASANAVSFSTIHGSKGLQYPITIIASCTDGFSTQESRSDIHFHNDLGIAFNYVDDDKNAKLETVGCAIINDALSKGQISEEMRLLYVAMTRAKERLVFLAGKNNIDDEILKHAQIINASVSADGKFDFSLVREEKSYAKWLMLIVLQTPNGRELLKELGFDIVINSAACFGEIDTVVDYTSIGEIYYPPETTPTTISSTAPDAETSEKIKEIFAYEYPLKELNNIEMKTSVSALTKRNAGREFCATSKPAFLSSGGLTPTERGTALHKFMQYADFSAAIADVGAEIERLYENEFISLAESEAIDKDKVQKFMESDLFKRLLNADKLFREQRFLLDVKAGDIYSGLSPLVADKSVIVQGAVDCMFIEDDHIVIIDFKTDRTTDEAFLLAHYSEQLKTYSVAAEKMFSLPVKECYIYSLHMSKKIKVK